LPECNWKQKFLKAIPGVFRASALMTFIHLSTSSQDGPANYHTDT